MEIQLSGMVISDDAGLKGCSTKYQLSQLLFKDLISLHLSNVVDENRALLATHTAVGCVVVASMKTFSLV